MTGRDDGARPPVGLVRLALIGLAGGFMSGLFGVGGGIIMVPLLMLLARLDQRRAAATSLAAILPASIAGSIGYLAGGQVDWWAALFVAVGSIVGSQLGTWLLRRLPVAVLRWGFIALLVVIAVRLLFAVPERDTGALEISPLIALALIAFGLFVGIASGLFGIGGGVLMVPVFIGVFGMGDLIAKGTSLLVMIPTSISGTIANLRARLVEWQQGLSVGLAAVVGSFGGVAVSFALPPAVATWLFAGLLAFTIVQMTVRAIRLQRRS
ncbi:sulfite exporter TauE/SafE family protein [Agromyces larvae]|uniref:Probable membrane transporter protein n=1 Tax=Agromyces larvae TaxID=2929802 RepID=A0ABY4BUB6_9MICO|nr:sulfite exporter TauE/SafE family protein [Agromyces larvae]UOE42798.1 sulfite exporter TauE/SafE family protein [Agromyces larvae]